MKKSGGSKERGGSGKKTIPGSPVLQCTICPATNGVMRNVRCGGAPMCATCAQKILRYSRISKAKADGVARGIVSSLMCIVIARRGYKEGYDAAMLLNNVLEE